MFSALISGMVMAQSISPEKPATKPIAVDDVVVTTESPLIAPIILPMYKGIPIVHYTGTSPRAETRGHRRDYHIERWLTLAALATEPNATSDPAMALQLAYKYAATQHWGKYFICSRMPCTTSADAIMDINYNIRGWKGSNEFEQARAQQAFAQDYKDILQAQIPSVPFEIYVAARASLGKYSSDEKGMPLNWGTALTPALGPEKRVGQEGMPMLLHRAIELQRNHIARTLLALPQRLPCEPQSCEKILSGLDKQRNIHAVFKLRVLAFGPFTDSRTGQKTTLFAEHVGPIVLHQNANLDSPLYTYADPPSFPEPALLAKGTPTFKNETMPLNGETLRLLILKHHPESQSHIDFQSMAQLRRSIDAVMYNRAALDGQWPKTEPWGPFFHAIHTPEGTLSDEVVKKYAGWTSARTQQPLSTLLLQFAQQKGSSLALPPVAEQEHLLSRGLFDAFEDAQGYSLQLIDQRNSAKSSPDKVIQKELDEKGIVPADNLILVETKAKDNTPVPRYVALGLTAKLTDYSVPTSSLPPNTADNVNRTSIEAAIESVSFEPTSKGTVMVILLVPKTAHFYTPEGLLAEARLGMP